MEDSGPLRGRWLRSGLNLVVWNGMAHRCLEVLLTPVGPWSQTSRSWFESRAATT